MEKEESNILYSPLEDELEDVQIKTLPSLIWEALDKYSQLQALVHSETGEGVTYGELKQKSENVARHLLQLGFGAGDTLTIFSSNCLEYVIVEFAVWRCGGVVALLSHLSISDDVRRELQRTNSRILYTSASPESVRGAIGTNIETIITKESHPGCISIRSMMSRVPSHPLPNLNELNIDPLTDTVAILFSSGTTGLPKGVELTHANLCVQIRLANIPSLGYTWRNTLIFQPLAHIYGVNTLLRCLTNGGTVIVIPRFSLENYLSLVVKYKAASIRLVPPVAVLFLKSGLVKKYDLSLVKEVITAAAPLAAETKEDLNKQLGETVAIRQAYGLTETTGLVVGMTINNGTCIPKYAGTIGILMPRHYAKVIDIDTGKALPANKHGELLLKGPLMMKCYLGDPESTRKTLTTDGWLHTGDICFYDENGCIYIVDRLKELIKYNAYQVSPSELEDIVLSMPMVADVCVIGRPDRASGELPTACVVVKADQKLTEKQVQDFVEGKVASYKRLRGGVIFVKEIPKSPTGKILRRQLKQTITQAIKTSNM